MYPNLTESDNPHKQQKYCQENDVKGGKEAKKRKDLSIWPAHVELNGNQTGEGSDGCAEAADIDTGKHVLPLICESGQHHCSRNIADNLACANSGKKCAGPQKPLEKHTDCIYAAQIFGYGKETDECKKQHIVQIFLIRRDKEHGEKCTRCCNAKNGFLCNKILYLLKHNTVSRLEKR